MPEARTHRISCEARSVARISRSRRLRLTNDPPRATRHASGCGCSFHFAKIPCATSFHADLSGGCSSTVRAPGCGPGGCGFETRHSPQLRFLLSWLVVSFVLVRNPVRNQAREFDHFRHSYVVRRFALHFHLKPVCPSFAVHPLRNS